MQDRILPPSRPHRDRTRLEKALSLHQHDPKLPVIVFVRGHYLNSMGEVGRDDINIYDDSCYLISNGFKLFESYNANTNPSFVRKGGRRLAQLVLGGYRFYKGKHKSRYNALRAYPEGVELPCLREGQPSTARFINIHKGATNPRLKDVTWSEGCLTIPDTQYGDFIQRTYAEMDRTHQHIIPVILLENRNTKAGQMWFDASGKVVA